MKHLPRLALSGLLVLAACHEGTTTPEVTLPVTEKPAAILNCTGSARGIACSPATQATGVNAEVIVGGQNQYIRLAGGTAFFSGSQLQVPVTVQNLLAQPMDAGSDWVTKDTVGVKVFFHVSPDNGVVLMSRDGTGTFTASNQDYIKYDEIIPGNGINRTGKTWVFALPDPSTTFTFQVYVYTKLPNEAGGVAANIPAHTFSTIGTSNVGGLCAVRTGGSIYCWGGGSSGQLGVNGTYNYNQPIQVLSPLTYTTVAEGGAHACGLTASATVMCWGLNSSGQLGDGTQTSPRLTPVAVSGLTGVSSIALGQDHSCAIVSGSLSCWGNAASGQLGEGTSGTGQVKTSPQQVTGLTSGVTQVSSGTSFTCAVVSGGAKCWGDRGSRSIGDNGSTSSGVFQVTPVDVFGLGAGSGVTNVATGFQHACAVVSGGVKCWGGNGSGQLGNNSTVGPLASPVDVVGLGAGSGVTQVAAGALHTCALFGTGSVSCWGGNTTGQIGQGNTNSPVLTPTGVPGLSNVDKIMTAGNVTCAHITDGTLKCWGTNGSGQVGDGTNTTPRSSPTSVVMP